MNSYFIIYLIGYALMIGAVWFGLDAAGISSTWKIVTVLFLLGLGIIYSFSQAQSDTARREQARNGNTQGGNAQGGNAQGGNQAQGNAQGGNASQGSAQGGTQGRYTPAPGTRGRPAPEPPSASDASARVEPAGRACEPRAETLSASVVGRDAPVSLRLLAAGGTWRLAYFLLTLRTPRLHCMWDSIRDGLVTLAEQYGVNPLIFAIIYVGTIPFYTASIGWVVRRLLRGRSYLLPGALAVLFYLSSYLYILAVGRNLPLWVYGLMIVMVGGGAAGLTAARLGARFGAKTLLIEQGHFGPVAEEGTPQLGGDATWEGCVPSKALLRSARAAHEQRHADRYGLAGREPEVDFAAVMDRVREARTQVFEREAHPRHLEALGAEVRAGRARFLGPHTVEIEQSDGVHTASARYFIITAGAAPERPDIEGLAQTPHLTTASVFEISQRPERLLILGAGPVGTELAQAFQRLGSQVTVVEQRDRILHDEATELAGRLRETLEAEGVRYHLGATVERVGQGEGTGAVFAEVQARGARERLEADVLLVATGRRAALDALHLDAADVDVADEGIDVSERCRTSQRHIFAAGDVTGRFQFTHMSEHMAKVAAQNALLKFPAKIDSAHLPWVTYTDPELAHVGATEAQLKEDGTDYEVYRFPYDKLDRALCEQETTGLIKVYATKWRGEILGASILGARAGNLICEYALAMKQETSLRNIADTIHPYPSYGLGARRAADQWYARKQTPKLVGWVKRIFGYRGEVIEPDPDRVV